MYAMLAPGLPNGAYLADCEVRDTSPYFSLVNTLLTSSFLLPSPGARHVAGEQGRGQPGGAVGVDERLGGGEARGEQAGGSGGGRGGV